MNKTTLSDLIGNDRMEIILKEFSRLKGEHFFFRSSDGSIHSFTSDSHFAKGRYNN